MRRIVKARAKRITLLAAGANLMPTVYKALDKGDGGQFELTALSKATEQGELLNVVYVPDTVDGHGDWMTKDAVKDMAHAATRDGMEIDLYHDGKILSKDDIFVAESFLINKADDRFQGWKDVEGKPVDLEGAFATVIKANDPKLRERIRSGELAQVSFEGPATVEASKAADDTPPNWITKLLKALGLGAISTSPDTEDMNKQETEALIEEAIKKALKPDEKPAPKAPEVDLKDPVAVRKHLKQLEDENRRLREELDRLKHDRG